MPSLPVNTSVSVSLPAGSSINITGNGAWAFIATVSGREIASGSYVGPDVIGPFTRAAVVGLTATVSDGLQYTVQDFAEGNAAAAALTTEQVTALQSVVSRDGNIFFPPTQDYAGIMAARASAIAAGGGVVQLGYQSYNIGANTIPLASGVVYRGQGYLLDSNQNLLGGTIVIGDPSVDVFAYNAVDNGSVEFANGAAFRALALISGGVCNMGVKGGRNNIRVGGMYAAGGSYCVFDSLYLESAATWNLHLENVCYSRIEHIYSKQSTTGYGHMLFAASSDSSYNFGNSEIRDLFAEAGGPLTRNIVFMARGSGTQFNDISAANIQANASGTKITQAATMSNASTDITVVDGTAFPLDMPVTVATTANGFNQYQTYFVVAKPSANVIRLSDFCGGNAIAATGSTAVNIERYGFPSIEIVGYGAKSANTIQSGAFLSLDAEGVCTSCIAVQNAIVSMSTTFTFSAQGTSNGVTLSMRNVFGGGTFPTTCICDLDSDSAAQFWFAYLQKRTAGVVNPNAMPQGLIRTTTSGVMGLNLGTRGSDSPHVAMVPVGVSGSHFIYGANPFGQKSQSSTSTSLSLIGSHLGAISYTGSSSATWTLPTLSGAAAAANSYVGGSYEIANCSTSAVNLTVNTAAGQPLNRQTGKTSVTIAPGQSLTIRGNTNGTDWWWQVVGNNGVTI